MTKLFLILCVPCMLWSCTEINKPALDLAKDSTDLNTNANYFTGKNGKPGNQDVLKIILLNGNAMLSSDDAGCQQAGRTPEEIAQKNKSLADYLSIYWQDHTDTSCGNHLRIIVEDGSNTEIKEKHWQVIFEIRGMAEEDPWGWGVKFFVVDKNWVIWKNKFQCIGVG